jgi:serine/threonine protein phosphatase 1
MGEKPTLRRAHSVKVAGGNLVLIVLPDLHGRSDLLEAALKHYPADTQFVFLGDAIDRGPDSRGTVRRLMELSDAGRIRLLCGNHEFMLLSAAELTRRAAESGDESLRVVASDHFINWERNGGTTVLAEFGGFDAASVPPELLEYFSRLELVYDGPAGYLCSHAAPPAWVSRYGSVEETIVWARPNDGPFPLPPGMHRSVHGHTPLKYPTWVGQHLYLDLGAFLTGALCTFDLETHEIIVLQGSGTVDLERLSELQSQQPDLIRPHPFTVVPL